MIVRRQGGLTEFIPSPQEKREGVLRNYTLDLLANLDARMRPHRGATRHLHGRRRGIRRTHGPARIRREEVGAGRINQELMDAGYLHEDLSAAALAGRNQL